MAEYDDLKRKSSSETEDTSLSTTSTTNKKTFDFIPALYEWLPEPIIRMCQSYNQQKDDQSRLKVLLRCEEALQTYIACLLLADYLNGDATDFDFNHLVEEYFSNREMTPLFFYLLLDQYRSDTSRQFFQELKTPDPFIVSYDEWEAAQQQVNFDDASRSLSTLFPLLARIFTFFDFFFDYKMIQVLDRDFERKRWRIRHLDQDREDTLHIQNSKIFKKNQISLSGQDKYLSLYPLVIFEKCEKCGESHLFFFYYFDQKSAIYIGFPERCLLRLQTETLLTDIADKLAEKKIYSQAAQWVSVLMDIFPTRKSFIPKLFAIYNLHGIQLYEIERYEEAGEKFQLAMTLRPDITQIYFNLILAYRKSKNYAAAIKIADQLLSHHPDLSRALELKAHVLEDQGKKVEALQCYERAFQSNVAFSRIFTSWRRVSAQVGKSAPSRKQGQSGKADRKEEKKSLVKNLTRDLTEMIRKNPIDPIYGRIDEIRQMLEVLTCLYKNNVILVGDPGAGKSALVFELGRKIVAKEVPKHLQNKRLIELNPAVLVAGTKFRGDLEERSLLLVSEISKAGDCLLFIDDIHAIVQAGGSRGSASEIGGTIKPALMRGEIQCVGTCSLDNYRRYIERDPALERRFQAVRIHELCQKDTLGVLEKFKGKFETYYGLTFPRKTLQLTVELSQSYLRDRALPDKAIDLLDRVGSSVTLTGDMSDRREATEEDVIRSVSSMSGIPVNKIDQSDVNRYRNMERILSRKIIGQDHALSGVSRVIRTNRLKFKLNPNGPEGIFLFMGPTGVGKTESARVLAEFLFGDKDDMIRIDMSEFSDRIATTKLIGAAPGYVGYNDPNQLTDRIRNRPYTLILLDEIEKADPQVLNIFLQVFDAGRLVDSKGREVSFSHTTIIMTSNIGSELFSRIRIGYEGDAKSDSQTAVDPVSQQRMTRELHRYFSPEFLGRIDELILFNPLTREHVKKIALIKLKSIKEQLQRENKKLRLYDSAFDLLVEKGFDSEFGARNLDKTIRRYLLDPLAEKKLLPKWKTIRHIVASRYRDQLRFTLKN
ncbi:MAG: hypothetical protein B6244_08105 [Candidatus Cloacimonetes bacterium 4572_55]|nr:MAG: hypothetical protein B6244_08105 [Candidatus Cloacimonetes bacterium 4572_55]